MHSSQSIFLLSAALATAAFVLTIVGSIRCRYISFKSTFDSRRSINFGIWYYESFTVQAQNTTDPGYYIYTSCTHYPEWVSIDSSWKATRVFVVLAFVIGLVFLVISIVASYARPHPAKAIVGPGLLLASLMQGLSLLFLDSNACKNNPMMAVLNGQDSPWKSLGFPAHCGMDTGAKCAIASTVLYLVSSMASCTARATERQEEYNENEQQHGSLAEPFLPAQPSIFNKWPGTKSAGASFSSWDSFKHKNSGAGFMKP